MTTAGPSSVCCRDSVFAQHPETRGTARLRAARATDPRPRSARPDGRRADRECVGRRSGGAPDDPAGATGLPARDGALDARRHRSRSSPVAARGDNVLALRDRGADHRCDRALRGRLLHHRAAHLRDRRAHCARRSQPRGAHHRRERWTARGARRCRGWTLGDTGHSTLDRAAALPDIAERSRVMAAVALGLIGVAISATLVPTMRCLRHNPATILRE